MDLSSSFPYNFAFNLYFGQFSDQADTVKQLSIGSSILRVLKFFKFLKAIRMLRVAKLKIIITKIIEYMRLSNAIIGFLGFLKLSFIILIIAHFCACFWSIFGYIDLENSWISKYGIQTEEWPTIYVSSIYWVTDYL